MFYISSLKYSIKTWVSFLRKITEAKKPVRKAAQVLDSDAVYSKVDEIIGLSVRSKVTVITPTTGNKYLKQAIESVQNQDFEDLRHLVVIDGQAFLEQTDEVLRNNTNHKIDVLVLPYNTGKNGMNGHRIYAALPFLVNSEYVFFLDQDNWYESNHISAMIHKMEEDDLDWVYAMRNIYTENGAFVTQDNCESIGDYPCFSELPPLIDTNCYGFRRSTLVKVAHYWYHPLRADRYFFYHLRTASPKFKSTGLYTVNYRLTEGRPPTPDYFLRGNQFMLDKCNYKLPWVR